MQQLILTLPTTAENLALDEWLLQRAESSEQPCEVLRLWENLVPAVIVGRSSRIAEEVNRDYCQANGIEYFRRSSGGASVVIGPGCLMYAVVLDYRRHPELKMLDRTHQFVMQKMQQAIESCGVQCKFRGTCDLTVDGRKFSGNSLRCQRNSFLYHGTLLYEFDLELLHQCLGPPPRQPDYRAGRRHLDFVTNLPCNREALARAITDQWSATTEYAVSDLTEVETLATEKYSSNEWTFKR